MKKNEIIKNVTVEKLVFGGKGFSRLKSDNKDIDGKAIFISGGVVPGSVVNIRILKSRKDYIEAQSQELVIKSPIEKEHPNNPFGMQAGLARANIPYDEQLKIKSGQVEESMFHLKKFQDNLLVSSIVPSPIIDGYRNKIEFSFGKYISEKEGKSEHFNVGFHKQGEFSKIQDFDGTILISSLANKIFKEIKDYAKSSGLPVYDQFTQKGFFRHIVIRQAFFTNQIMIIFSVNHKFRELGTDNGELNKKICHPELDSGSFKKVKNQFNDSRSSPEGQVDLTFIKNFFNSLAKKYSEVKSIYLSLNDNRSDTSIGELELIYGSEFIEEKLLGLSFNISPKSFFQTNSYGAEKLYSEVLNQVKKEDLANDIVLDLYGGTGTIGMIFAPHSKKVISVELVTDASKDGEANAEKNGIKNMNFVNAKVEDFLDEYIKNGDKADLLVIDPPRTGMHPDALPNILKFGTKQIIYVSCNPATLSRDLSYVLQNSDYKIEKIIPVDMFPHTSHIETIVSLVKS